MPDMNTPKNGDFAAYLDGVAGRKSNAATESGVKAGDPLPQDEAQPRQTIQQVIVEGQEPTDEFLEEFNALNEISELSDEELERQALSAPGDDGNVHTPE